MKNALSAAGLVLSLLLSACATTQHFARDPVREQAAAGEGVVLLSLTLNTGEVSQFDSVVLRRVDGTTAEHTYQLGNALPGLSRDTSLFTGVLPEGEYRLVRLSDYGTQKFLDINDKHSAMIGNFRVAAGQTTDLGRLVLTAINFNVMVGRSRQVTSNRALVEGFAPSYLPLLASAPQLGWTAPQEDKGVVESFATTRPQGMGGFSELSSGEVIGGTRMGMVAARSKAGKWRVLSRTGGLDAILWTVPWETADNLAVVGGELGTLMRIDRQGKAHPIAPGNLPRGNIFFVDHSPDGSQWIVGVQTPKEAVIYGSQKLENGQWERMLGDTIEFSTWNGARNVWAWPRKGGVGFASTQSKRLSCYDYAARQWQQHGTPGDRVLTALTASPSDVVGILTSPGGGLGGVFAATHYTRDCGVQWTETRSPYKVKVMPPLVLPSGTILETGGVFGDKGVYASGDNLSWTKYSDKISFSESLVALPTAGLLGVSRGTGIEHVQHSADEGRNWDTELSSIDYEMLKKSLGK